MAGETSTSHIRVAAAFADLFTGNGLNLASGVEGFFPYMQPDSWAVKLSLLAFPEDYLTRLGAGLWTKMVEQTKVYVRGRSD